MEKNNLSDSERLKITEGEFNDLKKQNKEEDDFYNILKSKRSIKIDSEGEKYLNNIPANIVDNIINETPVEHVILETPAKLELIEYKDKQGRLIQYLLTSDKKSGLYLSRAKEKSICPKGWKLNNNIQERFIIANPTTDKKSTYYSIQYYYRTLSRI